MNVKAIIPLVLAVVFGLVAALLVKNAIARRNAPATSGSNMVTVVVARDTIDPGRPITLADVTTSKSPADATPDKVFSDPSALVGRVAQIPVMKGQTILENLLTPAGTGGGLQSLIPRGMRAVTLEVNEFSGVGGMLQPGCLIDIVCVMRDEKNQGSVARTILQSIKLTAVGRATSPNNSPDAMNAPPPSHVTLLCTPKQVQVLELATTNGRPWLVLRSTRDGQVLPTEGTTMAELRGDDAATDVAIKPPAPAVDPLASLPAANPTTEPAPEAKADAQPTTMKRYVEILRGGSESRVGFDVPIPTDTASTTDTGDAR